MGDTATTTEAGNTLTVLSYESPLPLVEGSEPDPGSGFSAIEAEGCASPSSGRNLMFIGQRAFVLQTPDGIRVPPESDVSGVEVEGPVLETMDPKPGQCERKFVVFQTPRGERPDNVVFEEKFTTEAPAIRRAVPEA